jgi:hypothetical protein
MLRLNDVLWPRAAPTTGFKSRRHATINALKCCEFTDWSNGTLVELFLAEIRDFSPKTNIVILSLLAAPIPTPRVIRGKESIELGPPTCIGDWPGR